MKLSLLLAGIAVTTLVCGGEAAAQNYPWCAQYSGDFGGATNCGFVSFDQCMATVRGMGGFCVLNNLYVPPVPAPSPAQRRPVRQNS